MPCWPTFAEVKVEVERGGGRGRQRKGLFMPPAEMDERSCTKLSDERVHARMRCMAVVMQYCMGPKPKTLENITQDIQRYLIKVKEVTVSQVSICSMVYE